MSALETSLTEPLLADGEEEFIGNINADSCRSSSRSRQDVSHAEDNNNPSSNAQAEEQKSDADGDGNTEQSPLQNPELEYEPSDYDDDENDDQAPIKMIKVRQPQKKEVLRTANVPVCVQCENCNTTCETTVVHVFGMSTCLWVCILLVLCFPVAWLPLFWKDCHDTKHYCTYCSKELGRSKAKCCQFKKMGEELDQLEEDLEQRVAEAKVTML